jgi:two-component system, NarL family, response regulator NreC
MSPPPKVKLLLVDDHALVREGIRSSLVHYPFITVVGEASNGREAVRKCRELGPDIVLMDLNMPEMGGVEATPLIRKSCPKTRVIALTVHDTKEYVFELLRSGAIESVARGEAFFSPGISRILLQDYVQAADTPGASGDNEVLSHRETEVLQLIDQGKTTKEVAQQLKLSARTVETYRVRLKRKLRARNVAELLRHAREQRLL